MPLPLFDETIPGRVSSFWTHQQGLSRHHQKPKPHICNNMKNVVSFYYKFLQMYDTVVVITYYVHRGRGFK